MRDSLLYLVASILTALITLQSVLANDPVRFAAATLETSSEGRMMNQLSIGLRSTLATAVFLRADEYMHQGDPLKMVTREGSKVVKESLMGVSWRNNQEIVTLLKFCVMLDPSFTQAHSLLGEHLTRDRHHFREGIGHLQQAVLYNENNPRLYQLYGQAGQIYFESRMYPQAKGYLERAIGLYTRVRSKELVGTDLFEGSGDRLLLRTYLSFVTSCYFEMRDWKKTYEWWKSYGEFATDNRISKWMARWTLDPNATFRPEDYKDDAPAERTEANRNAVTETSFESAKHPDIWLTPDFPKAFYDKLWFLMTIVIGLVGALYFKRLW